MNLREKWIALGKVPAVRTSLFVLGCLLLLATPFVGVLPGPGGVIFFGAGAALVLKYSEWAKRRYALFKRRHPKWASWSDWALRRPSPRRREELSKRREGERAAAEARAKELACVERPDGQAKLVLVRHQVNCVGYFIERRFDPDGSSVHESYWAAVGFSGLYEDVEAARADGMRELERV